MNDDHEKLTLELTAKQEAAWRILHDAITIELLFGGGAGGGKTRLGCLFIVLSCLKYPGIRCMIGRETLKGLKESTLLTFFDICTEVGLIEGEDFTYNQQESVIEFEQTKSSVYLKELAFYPADPNFDRLGSTEYTFAFIDEAQQILEKAKGIVRSRLRYRHKEYGLMPKLLMTCNPSKGWLYTTFYRPSKEGALSSDKKFLQALLKDNPFVGPQYEETLRGLDKETRERLLFGNWEYDDDPSALIQYDAIIDLFSNVVHPRRDNEGKVIPDDKYLVCDVARFGGDRTVISYWEGWCCKRIGVYSKLPTVPDPTDASKPSVAGKLREWRELYGVALSHTLVDEDGVGGGVVDFLKCKGFQGGRKPFPMPTNRKIQQNFLNLRAQCSFKLADFINDRKVAVPIENKALRDQLAAELEQIKAKDHDKDRKLQIVGKDEIKSKLGRSPDLADNLMMRVWFEFASKPSIFILGASAVPATPDVPGTRKLSRFEMGL